jgi:hypothetical protein
MTVTEVAKRLEVTTQAVHNRIRRGTIKAEKVNGSWKVGEEECKRLFGELEPVDHTCTQCEALREQNVYLRKRVEWFEGQVERQSVLLLNEQQRVKALPSPFSWLKRLIGRGQSMQ